MTIRFVPREPPPEPPERELWRLQGPSLPVVCIERQYEHGSDLLLFQGDELARSALIRTGPADVATRADEWKRILLERGWTEHSPD
jgi:hypothetical protein